MGALREAASMPNDPRPVHAGTAPPHAPLAIAVRGDGVDAVHFGSVAVVDVRSGEAFELTVPPADALEAFRHPYAYATRGRSQHALVA